MEPMLSYNTPLRIGQILEPREKTLTPKCRITDFMPKPEGIIWLVAPYNGGPEQRMTLSEIYATFKFDA